MSLSRIAVEDLLSAVPKVRRFALRFGLRVLLIRVHARWSPVGEPSPFQYAVVAVVLFGVAHIKAMCKSGVVSADLIDTFRILGRFGVGEMRWQHNGRLKSFRGRSGL